MSAPEALQGSKTETFGLGGTEEQSVRLLRIWHQTFDCSLQMNGGMQGKGTVSRLLIRPIENKK